tara:strand:- start:469 stop:687 length:219 start_codon:yes stop_codon:yes gene_type:complete
LSENIKLEKIDRTIMTLAESNKDKKMTRKVDTYEYETLAECIRSDQVPASEIAEIFTDKAYYKWYKKKYLNK